MSKILVVDDESVVLHAFQDLLGDGGHDVVTARKAETALERLELDAFDAVVMDICLLGMDGLEALRSIKRNHPMLPVIVMTGHGTMQTAIEATRLGAFDYHLKPFEPADMMASIEKALESTRLTRTQVVFDAEAEGTETLAGDVIVGRSPGMQQVYMAIGRVAPTGATVLIRGESGTGKELVARAIHQYSTRSDRPLLAVNCAAIPETLMESELFGYERGAFTGADTRKIGKFEQASGGTIFLDEIGDVSPGIQAKVLRVLQERQFELLGGKKTVHVDVRVLAATNRDLEKAIAEGTFRNDLYHRINVVTIRVPPLRERPGDIPRLVDYFLKRYSRELGIDKPAVAPEALRRLEASPWPGNIRQLANCLQRALIFTRGHPIQAGDLPLEEDIGYGPPAAGLVWKEELSDLIRRYLTHYAGERTLEDFIMQAERLLLVEALERTNGHQTHAARLLGIPRPTLHAKARRHALHENGDEDRR